MAFFVCLQKFSSSLTTPTSNWPLVRILFTIAPMSRKSSAMTKESLQHPSQPHIWIHKLQRSHDIINKDIPLSHIKRGLKSKRGSLALMRVSRRLYEDMAQISYIRGTNQTSPPTIPPFNHTLLMLLNLWSTNATHSKGLLDHSHFTKLMGTFELRMDG